MRFAQVPERLLASPTAVRVLRLLVASPGREMTGRQLAGAAGAPHPRVIERLRQLESEGLVSWRVVGRAHVWRLEQQHVLVKPLQEFFAVDARARAELRRTLRRSVGNLRGVAEARLFGSVARGDEQPTSDIDLLLVVDDRAAKAAARRAMDALGVELRTRFGNSLQAYVVTSGELRRRPRRAFLGPARSEGELLAGRSGAAQRA